MNILLFRIVLVVLSLIPLVFGALGYGLGASYLLNEGMEVTPRLDNQFRYLSGVYLAVTAAAWWTLIDPIRRVAPIRIAALGIFAGGLARLVSISEHGWPDDIGMIVGVGIEVVLVPLLILWHSRIIASAR